MGLPMTGQVGFGHVGTVTSGVCTGAGACANSNESASKNECMRVNSRRYAA